MVLRGLPRMYRPGERLFAFQLRQAGDQIVPVGRSPRYTAIVLIEKVTSGPRSVLQLAVPRIAEDTMANLTLIDPAHQWVLDDRTNFSRSKNSPWYGTELTGKAVAVFNNGHSWIEAQ